MASNSSVQQAHFQQHQQQNPNPHHCKECGLYLNSAESLEVHLQYHKENLLNKWANQAATSHSEETNNNNTKTATTIKREFNINNTIAAAADSSDSMTKKSPEYSRATPENMFGHPPTPQSYQSASSPYQNPDNSTFSPNFQPYQPIKSERLSPNHYSGNYPNFNEQFFPMDSQNQQQNYNQDFSVHKTPVQNSYRYHPYQSQSGQFDRPQSQTQVSSSSPAYPPQPTPSPSPKQCDKCGYVCESASQLIDHLNIAHPPTPAPHLSTFQSNQHFMFGGDNSGHNIKIEEDAQSEILDLDSHKVHQVFPEDEKRPNNDLTHSVPAMLGSWPPHDSQSAQNQKMFQSEQQRMYINTQDQKPNMFNSNVPSNIPEKMYGNEQKLFQPHQMPNQEFLNSGVTTTTQDSMGQTGAPQAYRPFEHLPSQPSVISSTQVPNTPTPPTTSTSKSASWKSNEARRPKTYNCTACNKWFTSSGHLKRHYNTTLHKNAVKSSGQPDPASLPISAHHHPARDSATSRDDRSSSSPGEESRDESNSLPSQFERPSPMPGMLQQPPNGPYDRQPAPNIHQPPPLHSPMGQNMGPLGVPLVSSNNLSLSNGSPPNGEAGPSAISLDSRGLLSLNASPSTAPGFNMGPPMIPMESTQFQMYPNVSAPHVTQPTATNSLNTIGEQQPINSGPSESQPLPSFAQIQAHRYGLLLSYGSANVGGGGPVTAPYTYYTDPFDNTEPKVIYRADDDDYRLTVLTSSDQLVYHEDEPETILPYPPSPQYSPSQNYHHNNNISDEDNKMEVMEDLKLRLEAQPASPEKAHIKRDYEENTGSPRITSTVVHQQKINGVHKCFDCDKIFNKACYLTQHNKTFHSGDKPFKCTRCGKRFSCETTYQEHLPRHAGEKPHKCELCPKQFNHKTDLRRHMCLHTGQKPYACETCGKGFIRKDHMLKHCDTHTRKALVKMSI